MTFRSFDEILSACASSKRDIPMAVVCAEDENSLSMAADARSTALGEPILIGKGRLIHERLSLFPELHGCRIIDCGEEEAPKAAVELINSGEAAALVKGHIETAALMHAVVKKENNMLLGSVLSHTTVLSVPGYSKLLGLTDCAIIPYPDAEKKAAILENAIDMFRRMGYEEIKAAVLAAAETINPKIQESTDAAALSEMAKKGRFGGCVVEGPVSYDIAVSADVARQKEYPGKICGDADLLVVPNLTAGNILLKSLTVTAGAKGAGIILGAKVPIVLTSRASSGEAKLRSLALAFLAADK